MIQELKKFFFYHGHAYVPAADPDYADLYQWCKNVRFNKSRLDQPLIDELDQLGFDWEIYEPRFYGWMFQYYRLEAYYKQYGHTQVKAKEDASLSKWVCRQRIQKSTLSDLKLQLLEKLKFQWSDDLKKQKEEKWQKMYEWMLAFYKEHGHFTIPSQEKEYRKLSLWVQAQRSKEEKLSPKKKQKLLAVNFPFSNDLKKQEEENWMMRYAELKAFVKEHGHARVPSHSKTYNQLAAWVSKLRLKEKDIPAEKKKLLDDVGFAWAEEIRARKERLWQKRYRELKAYYQEHGHSRIPDVFAPNPSLGKWVSTQRTNKAKLPEEKIALLNAVGFVWREKIKRELRQNWNQRYEELKLFYEQHGHSKVPEGYEENKQLANWVAVQRQHKYRLSKQRIEKLEELNFLWQEDLKMKRDEAWMEQYRKLVAFKRKNGHCRVPITYEDQKFARWIAKQRRTEKKLPLERWRLLDQIGFTWHRNYRKLREEQWLEMFSQLQDFQKVFGHCRVPERWPENPKLAQWVSYHRSIRYRLEEEKLAKLNAIGFIWDARQYTFQKVEEMVEVEVK